MLTNFEDQSKNLAVRFLGFFLKPSAIPPLEDTVIRSILVVRQHDQLGDMLCVIPLLRSLKQLYPGVRITLVASPVNYEIMRWNPYVDEVINYNKQQLLHSFSSIRGFLRNLRNQPYDMAVVPATVSVSVTSDLMAYFSRATIRIGAKSLTGKPNPTAFCFTHGNNLDWAKVPHRHQTLRNIDGISMLRPSQDDLSLEIGLTEEERQYAKGFLSQHRKQFRLLVGFHPGAGKKENRWDTKRFGAIANRIAKEFNACIVITEGPKDEEQVTELKQYLQCSYIIVRQQSIRTVAALINELDYFVSNDTGIMHIAGGTRTRLLALFGPTDPFQWSPQGKKNRFIASNDGNIISITEEQVYITLCEMIKTGN